MKRAELGRIRAVKFSEAQVEPMAKFQEWLWVTPTPETGHPLIRRNQFSDPVRCSFNQAYRHTGAVAGQIAPTGEAV